jgi:hypothetical protein
MKTAIIGIINNPATSENSHSAGMNYIVSKLFDAPILNENEDWNDYDRLIIYHGVNFKEGSFNIIGGFSNDIFIRIKKLIDYKGEILTLDGFQLIDLIKARKLYNYTYDKVFNSIKLPNKDKLVIGDSHSISVWPNEEYTISRNDGKTLHGFLKLNLDLSNYKEIIFYFGNIDIRFHLARQSNPIEATKDLFNHYCEYASKYNCSLTQLLPIEDESRKIPSTGLYKGKPFYGGIELRKELRNIANDIMKNSNLKFIEWPDYFVDINGNLKFDIMEPKQSVHIRPKYYQRNIKKQLSLF